MWNFDPLHYPHASRRTVRYAIGGMVATSQHLAANAGCEMLRAGGNAVDAAIATAISLTVVEPTSNGIGGDCFALIWNGQEMAGLNASGRAPARLTIEYVRSMGHDAMPLLGPLTVTVPGAVSGWEAMSTRFGALPFPKLFEPAIRYAREGFAVSPTVGGSWATAADTYRSGLTSDEFSMWCEVFAPDGTTPEIGSVWALRDQADTLETLAREGAAAFYQGSIAEKIDAFARRAGLALRGTDLSEHRPEWIDPISTGFRGATVWEMPPNGQGLIALMALNIIQRIHFDPLDLLERQHVMIEATKRALVDGQKFIADPAVADVPIEWLLSDTYATTRAAEIVREASAPSPLPYNGSGTVYLAAADRDGMMVSMIQSNYKGFGSGLVVPGTGISLHNRGREFSLDARAKNALAPGKRPYHTIIPGFLRLPDGTIGPFGVMGGYMQPQGHVQVISSLLDDMLNPQAALDVPRWRWDGGLNLSVEPQFPLSIAQALARRGHQVRLAVDATGFGRGQIILRHPSNGVLAGGTDPRADGDVGVV